MQGFQFAASQIVGILIPTTVSTEDSIYLVEVRKLVLEPVPVTMNAKFANEFATAWIDAWNNGDLAAVLAHYTDNFEMSSPNIQTVFGEPSGRLVGKERVREYWQMMLSKFGTPKMELIGVFVGAGSIAIEHRNRGRKAVEIFFFEESGLVSRAAAHYIDDDIGKKK